MQSAPTPPLLDLPPIRQLVFVTLLLGGAALIAWNYVSEVAHDAKDVEILAQAGLQSDLTGIAHAARGMIANGDWKAVRDLMTYRSADPDVRATLILDARGKIFASAHSTLDGTVIQDLPASLGIAFNAQQLHQAATAPRGTTGPLTLFSSDRNVAAGVTAVHVPNSRTSYLVAVIRDLHRARQSAKALAIGKAERLTAAVALYVLAIGFLLHFTIDRRVRHLVDVARRHAAGDRRARTGMRGRDEFACIGAAMDRMADSIDSRLDEMHVGEQLLRMQIEVLEAVAKGNPIEDAMKRLCLLVQRQLGRGWCSVWILDESESALRIVAAPSFPPALIRQVDGLGPDQTACGVAVLTRQRVITTDALADPRWAACRELMTSYGIRAVWSQPFAAEGDRIIGTVALIFDTPGAPSSLEEQLLLSASHMAGNAWRGHQTRATLLDSETRYRSVVAAVSEGVMVRDQHGRVVTCNDAAIRMLGFKWDAEAGTWRLPRGHRWIREDGSTFPRDLYPSTAALRTGKPRREAVIGFEMPCQDPRWLSVSSQPLLRPESSIPYAAVSSFSDITMRRAAEKRLAVRTRLLEIAAQGLPTIETLDRVNLYIESCTKGVRCSVLLVDENDKQLRHGSAPSLPAEYNAMVDGLPIGPKSGSCGTAAYRDAPVMVADTGTDPLWESYRDVALRFNLPACWSTPIHGDDNKVIGTFAMYFDQPHMPTVEEVGLVENATNIVALILQRQVSKTALAASELRYQTLVQAMGEGLLVLDRERRVQTWNRAADRIFGVSWESRRGQTLGIENTVLIGDDGRTLAIDEYPSSITLRTGQPQSNFVIGQKGHDGHVTWLSTNTQPLKTGNEPLPSGVLLTFNDITEQKLAEHRLRASIENTPNVAVQWYDADGRIVFWNPASEAMFGWSSKEAVGRTLDQLILNPEDAAQFADEMRQLSTTGGSVGPAEHGFRHRNGWEGTCMSTIFSIPSGADQPYFARMDVDITERKQAEQALQESEQRWQFALEGSNEGVWDWDIVSNRVYSSKRLIEMVGYSEQDWTYTLDQWEAQIHPDDRERVWEATHRHLRGETDHYAVELRQKCRDGKYRWFLDRGMVISRDERGEPLRMIGTQSDITERKQAEAELQGYRNHLEEMVKQRTAELRDINEELEAFTYSISHDLRTPLRGIDGFSQALLEDYGDKLDDTGRTYLTRVRTAAQWLGRLIDSMLQLSGVTRHTMRDTVVSLSAICDEVIGDIRRRDAGRDVAVTIAPHCVVHGDPQLLRVLIENLLGNAWKYTGKRLQAHIEFGRRPDDGAFFVKDDGAGFDPAYAQKLFVPFQRLHDARDFEGTGVGLASVQRIVRRHGGRIWAEAQAGQGATFFFTLGGHGRPTELAGPHRDSIAS